VPSGRNRESRSREAAGRRNSREAVPNGEGGMGLVRMGNCRRAFREVQKHNSHGDAEIVTPPGDGCTRSPRWDGIASWDRLRCGRN